MQELNLAIIGGGTVGGGVYRALQRNGALMASRLGVRFKVAKVVVRNPRKKRAVKIPARLLSRDWKSVIDDPRVRVVLEVMGGTTEARSVVAHALKRGKPVVTANKALLSAHGESLFELAEQHHANIYYEASVAGGIPIIKVLREALIGNRITHLYGIANGTCNYILTHMKEEGLGFEEVLAEAQRLGYAEADPSLDVDGEDAMHKIGIMASLAHGFWVNPKQIFLEGIREVTPLDIQFADQVGYAIKLLGIVKLLGKGNLRAGASPRVQVSVCPTLIPAGHVLASVNGVFNAVYVRGDIAGDTLYYGHGAGRDATASAVLSDLADAALDLKFDTSGRIPPFVPHEQDGKVVPMEEIVSQFYLRLSVIDRPGVLAQVSRILAETGIGISSVIQPEGHVGESVPLMLMIHDATDSAMNQALRKIAKLAVVKARPVLFRVENFD